MEMLKIPDNYYLPVEYESLTQIISMELNLRDNEDAFTLLSILKLAEKDIENGNIKDSKTVFKELKERLTKNG